MIFIKIKSTDVNKNGNKPKRPNNEIHPSPIRGTFFVRNDGLEPIRLLTDVSTILYLDQNLYPVGNRGVSVIVAVVRRLAIAGLRFRLDSDDSKKKWIKTEYIFFLLSRFAV